MLEPGDQVGRYEIQRRLGGGGMGTVYVGHDPVLGRLVGIKLFNSDLDIPDARERFAREARSAANLAHPNIVAVFDYGEFRGQPYIVMEYVPGDTLAEVIRRRDPVPLVDKLRWTEELCAGAAFAHQRSVVHRDIKPANLVIDRSGRLRILDFGVARVLALASRTTGMMSGTPGYMAPEQILGNAIDHRVDLFSIGAVFYELLSYADAFPGETLPAITHKILTQEPVPIEQFLPQAAVDLGPIVERALKKDPEERFPDAESIRAAIGHVRRQYEADAGWTSPTRPRAPLATPRPGPNRTRGSGSEKHRVGVGAGIAQMTPPPTSPRTDAALLARRRAVQIETAVRASRQFLAIGDLEAAREKCDEALALDPQNAATIALDDEIAAAIAAFEEPAEPVEREPPVFAPTVLRLTPPPQPGEHPAPPSLAPIEQVEGAPAYDGAGIGPVDLVDPGGRVPVSEPTVIAPVRHMPSSPPVSARHTPVPAAPIPPPVPAPAVPKAKPPERRQPAAPRGPSVGQRTAAMLRSVGQRLTTATGAAQAVVLRPRTARANGAIAGGVAAVVIAAAVIVYLAVRPAPMVATGILIIDAVPWATITALEDEQGRRQPLPSPAATPLSLTVPAGTYRLLLAGPHAEQQRSEVVVAPGKAVTAPIARFGALTPEAYFEQYLASPAEAPAPAAADPVPPAVTDGAQP